MARACAARLRTIDSSAICLACGLRSVTASSRSFETSSRRERNLYTTVSPALASDLQHADIADFRDVPHVRTPARLQVDTRNPEQAHPSRTARRLHAHRLHQLRARVELLVGDPDRLGVHTAGDERIRLGLDLRGIEQAHVDVEIETSLVASDVAAGKRPDHPAGQYVQSR